MADKALDVIEQSLTGDDPRLAVPVAMKIIEHVLPKSGMEQPLGISPEAQQKDRRLSIIAEIIDGSITKSQVYGHPLPPKIEKIKQELDRRAEEERGSSAV